MPEALARTDHDFVLAAKPRKAQRKSETSSRKAAPSRLLRIVKSHPGATMGAVAGTVLVLGILVNALILQKQRHPAPLFASRPAVAAHVPAAAQQQAEAPALVVDAVPKPTPRPSNLTPPSIDRPAPSQRAALREAAEAPRSSDAIASLLRANTAAQTGAEASKTVFSAQRALVKLGFVLKPDGVMGGTTRQAIERFERDRGMPVRGDLTPKIIKMLAAESGVAID